MSELSREERALLLSLIAKWIEDDAALPTIRTALAGGGGGEKAERAFWEEVRRRDNEVVKYLTELGAANTAFHAGWVSRADHRALESRLAAAEKRAEEACREREAFYERVMELTCERDALKAELAHLREVRFTTICSFCDQTVCSLGIEDDQRGAVQSHIETCPKHPMRNLEYRLGEAARERDAALARVKDLQCILGDIHTLSDKPSMIDRDAAGAQP